MKWSGADAESGVATYAVRYRAAALGQPFGEPVVWLGSTTATSASFTGTPGTTSCFAVVAVDKAGNSSRASAERCTAIPIDDAVLWTSGRWLRLGGKGYFLNTFSRSTTPGASLDTGPVQARRLAVLATTCPACGEIWISWNGVELARPSLVSATTKKGQVISLPLLGGVQSGNLFVQVVSSGARVEIDGVRLRAS